MTLRLSLLLAALLWVASADAQRGRKADLIALTPAATALPWPTPTPRWMPPRGPRDWTCAA